MGHLCSIFTNTRLAAMENSRLLVLRGRFQLRARGKVLWLVELKEELRRVEV